MVRKRLHKTTSIISEISNSQFIYLPVHKFTIMRKECLVVPKSTLDRPHNEISLEFCLKTLLAYCK